MYSICIFSVIYSCDEFSVSEIILISSFAAQETCLIIINAENIFVVVIYYHSNVWGKIEKLKRERFIF